MRWSRGDEIHWREVWRNRVLGVLPVLVVADRDDLLAVYIPEGAPFSFPEKWPWDTEHPWERRGAWEGPGALILHRPGDAYTVWAFWEEPNRTFAGWYINLQEPFLRGARTLDTFDHELDIWVAPNGAWQYKDERLLDRRVRQGRFSRKEAAAIRETARQVVSDLDRGKRWWANDWATWKPDPSWTQRFTSPS